MLKKILLGLVGILTIGTSFAQTKPLEHKNEVKYYFTQKNRFKYEPVNVLGIDVRRSVMGTALVDTYQTSRFRRLGLIESWNPIAEVALNSGGNWLYVPAAVLSIFALDDVLRKADPRDRPWMYVLWYGLEVAATLNNRRLGTGGMPIVIPVISGRFGAPGTKEVKYKL